MDDISAHSGSLSVSSLSPSQQEWLAGDAPPCPILTAQPDPSNSATSCEAQRITDPPAPLAAAAASDLSTPAPDNLDAHAPDRIVEAILFAADSPITPSRLADLAGLESAAQARTCVDALNARYAAGGMTFRIEMIARGYQMLSLPAYQPYVARLREQHGENRLSPAAMETLAIIAYKQPIIRADVEAIRGVACGEVINRLREVGLVRAVGRAEIVGRPMLYGTTKRFLDLFGLPDLADLPPLEALRVRAAASQPSDVAAGASAA